MQQFAARFNEFRLTRDELAPLESLLRDATQRKARQEAGEAARRPSVRVVEPAFASQDAWQPLYTRDAAIVLGASFLLALLVMGVVELFNRVDAPPTVVMGQAPTYPAVYPNYAGETDYQLGFDASRQGKAQLPRPAPGA